MVRGSSSLSAFKYLLQAHTKDAHRELRGGDLFLFLYKVEKKYHLLLVRMTLETQVFQVKLSGKLKYFM